jgi:hypothetical protein
MNFNTNLCLELQCLNVSERISQYVMENNFSQHKKHHEGKKSSIHRPEYKEKHITHYTGILN